jgi:hypothetical protein
MPIPSTGRPAVDEQLGDYYGRLEALALLALAGSLTESEFVREMARLVAAGNLLLFLLGGGEPTLQPAQARLRASLRQARGSIRVLADDIFSGRYSPGERSSAAVMTAEDGRAMLGRRMELWAGTAAYLYHSGQVLRPSPPAVPAAGGVPGLVWRLGATERHCADCARLDGRALTREGWLAAGVEPKSPQLQCGGWRCDCRFEEVVLPGGIDAT